MTMRLATTLPLLMVMTLTACGGGGGDGGSNTDSGGGGGTPGPNGLPFGAEGQSLDDAEGVAATSLAATVEQGNAPDIENVTITVNRDFFDGGLNDLDGTIEIFGETVIISNGSGNLNGDEVLLTFEPNRVGTYTAVFDIDVVDSSGTTGAGAYVFGFETDPTVIAARTTGSLIYNGDFQATGSLDGGPVDTEYEGDITITVDFVGDSAGVDIDGTLNGSTTVNLDADSIALSGNGFSGGLECTSGCNGVGSSSIDATFFGPDADEVGGVLGVDVSVGGNSFEGAGSFIVTP
ncbi:hypothetical protein BC777_0224 [Yoonia maricola]|uniref:Transferrin-binding protein B C-lobe/N-lobe beta-barrel domain-containing protein n=1 Tax=Yoonia maricola TaxID=420999 RepID=A0A2M8WKF5_9RHOB|nr:transferrin-binding protein-like solute binding protein [Yoonia maricola]PJI91397.1 hypothetical protein BC777_0224 [Yoonia maricola]